MHKERVYKMNVLRKSMMFILSFSPLYVILATMNIDILIRVYYQEAVYTDYIFILILCCLFIISLITILAFIHVPVGNHVAYKEIKTSKDAVISYIFTYIIPFISIDLGKLETIVANVMLFFLIWLLYVKSNLFYLNPVLVIMGYSSYEADNIIIITDIPYYRLTRISELKGSFFTPDIFIAKASHNKL